MVVLGIETSCDETAASVVQDGNILLSNVVFSSMDLHVIYGGVVPEIAARSHIESILPVIEQALRDAFPIESTKSEARNNKQIQNSKLKTGNSKLETSIFDPWSKIDAIAVTYGAGLGGSLLVGVMTAKTLAITKNKPLYAINHVEGHVYANFITKVAGPEIGDRRLEKLHPQSSILNLPSTQPSFPLLALIVSGGHSQLVLFRNHFDYTLLGQTRDDAIGEAFDKVAKITGFPYPGGPGIAKAAESGDPTKYKLPKSKLDQKYEFSFSGIKTAVLRLAQELVGKDYTFPSHLLPEALSEAQKNDIAASFQRVAIETVVDKTVLAYEEFQPKSVVIAGGVAANTELRRQLTERLGSVNSKYEIRNTRQTQNPILQNGEMENGKSMANGQSLIDNCLLFTDSKLCTDNAAMIASLGCFKMKYNQPVADPYTLQIEPNLSM